MCFFDFFLFAQILKIFVNKNTFCKNMAFRKRGLNEIATEAPRHVENPL